MLLAATPRWIADNFTPISLVILAACGAAVLRMVQRTAVRVALLSLIALVGVFVYVNRGPLKACARTCECQIADRDIDVPFCDPDIGLSDRR